MEIKMRKRYLLISLISLTILGAVYYSYGMIYGFKCAFVLENHLYKFGNDNIIPINPDVTILVNEDTLTSLNLKSNQIHKRSIIQEKLGIGENTIAVYSDSARTYTIENLNIYYPRIINIDIFQSVSGKHLSIAIE